jgi:hypothetical protein
MSSAVLRCGCSQGAADQPDPRYRLCPACGAPVTMPPPGAFIPSWRSSRPRGCIEPRQGEQSSPSRDSHVSGFRVSPGGRADQPNPWSKGLPTGGRPSRHVAPRARSLRGRSLTSWGLFSHGWVSSTLRDSLSPDVRIPQGGGAVSSRRASRPLRFGVSQASRQSARYLLSEA